MSLTHKISHGDTADRVTLQPLRPEERAAYALTIQQTEAVMALEGMEPAAHDKAINAAILAGRVAPEQAREEFLAYVTQHKTISGFIESRDWAV